MKIHPVIQAVRKNSMAIEPEPVHSIDSKSFLQKQNEAESVNLTQRNDDSKCLSVQVKAE